jgi:hypothetical protein
MGCEPILNLAVTPDEAVSIICTVVNKTILQTLWGKLTILLIGQCSVGHPAGALAIICLWILLTWLTYAYRMLCQDDIAPGEFLLVQCACQLFFWTEHINSCMFMINY